MAAVFVEVAYSSVGITDATFDHSSTNAGGGYYDVALDVNNGDFVFTTYAPGYNTQVWDYRYGGNVPMSPVSGGGGGGGGTCF